MMTGVNLTLLVQNTHFFAGRQRVKTGFSEGLPTPAVGIV